MMFISVSSFASEGRKTVKIIEEKEAYVNKAKISFEQTSMKIIKVFIYDLNGKEVRKNSGLAKESYEVDGYGLDKGKYYFKVLVPGFQYQGNLVVE